MDITVRWAAPSTANIGSTYKVRRTLNNVDWTVLALAQPAVAPYASPKSTITANVVHGATSIVLTSGTSFSNNGYGIIDDASITWTGKTLNTLTGVVWKTGSGTYELGTELYEAHESYEDTGITITHNAILYGITHIDENGISSQENFEWFLSPPVGNAKSCTVIVADSADLGFELKSGVTVVCTLFSDAEFRVDGWHLDSGGSTVKSVLTNAFGLAFFQCVKDKYRKSSEGAISQYKFVIGSGTTGEKTIYAQSIPDQPFVLLADIL